MNKFFKKYNEEIVKKTDDIMMSLGLLLAVRSAKKPNSAYVLA